MAITLEANGNDPFGQGVLATIRPGLLLSLLGFVLLAVGALWTLRPDQPVAAARMPATAAV